MGFKRQIVSYFLSLEVVFVVLWSSGFVGAEYGLQYTDPFTLLFWRYFLLSLGLGLWLTVSKRFIWPGLGFLSRQGLIGLLAHGIWLSCVLVALDFGVPGGIVALVTALQPLLTGSLAGFVLKEKTIGRQWFGLVVGFLGVGLVVGARLTQGSTEVPGFSYFIPLGSVVAITIASFLEKRWAQERWEKNCSLDQCLFVQSLATTIALFAPAYGYEGLETEWSFIFIITLLWLVIGVSFGSYWVMEYLFETKQAACVSSLFYLSPPVTMLMAWVAFGDQLKFTDLVGLFVTGVGALIVFKSARKTSRKL